MDWGTVLNIVGPIGRQSSITIMIATALIVVGVTLACAAVVVLLLSLARAPEGAEDEAGFHHVQQPVVESTRHYRARVSSRHAAKATSQLKAHIPAA
jgi:hypothetical protein